MADKYKLLFLLETGERWTVATTTVTLQMHTGSGYLVMMVVVMMVLVTVVSPIQASQEGEEAEEGDYQPRVLSSNCFSGDLLVLMLFISVISQS